MSKNTNTGDWLLARSIHRALLPFVLTASSTFGALSAHADTAPANSGALDEIVVTAQKRTEKLQDVPIAITAFSADQISSRGITNVSSLNGLAPNVQITTDTSDTTGTQFSIRGAITINPAMYWDPTVGVYVDGVYVAKSLGSVFDLLDLERIEVLNGPQGTLYGRNTLAGAVNIVTKAPSGVFGGALDVTYGNYNEIITKASLDLPKIGIASISLGVRRETRDGVTDATPDSAISSYDNRDQVGGRFAMNLDFSDAFQAAYRFDYSDVNQRPLADYLANVQTWGQQIGTEVKQYEKSYVQGHSLTLRWDLDATTQLKSITGYRKANFKDNLDFDGSVIPLANTARDATIASTSEELQLVGSSDRINYVTGVYYYKDNGYTYNPQAFFGGAFDFESEYGYGTKAWAVYGQVDYKATDQFTVTGGLRYTSEKKSLSRYETVFFALDTPVAYQIPLVPAGTEASKTFSAVTPVVTLAYKLTNELNTYLKFSEGFKSGGFNGEYGDLPADQTYQTYLDTVANNVAQTKTPFQPEKDKTTELGLKALLADGKLMLNTDVFYNKVSDQQLSIFVAGGAAASVIRNAGSATVSGFELSAMWAPIPDLHLQANYGYLHAKYDTYVDGGVNVAGNRAFVHAPQNTLNLTVEGKVADTRVGGLYATAEYNWVDAYYDYPYALTANYPGDTNSNPDTSSFAGPTQIKSVGLLNGRLSLRDMDVGSTKLTITLWGKNLTNEHHIVNNIDFGAGFGHLTPTYYGEPRTFGIEIHDKF